MAKKSDVVTEEVAAVYEDVIAPEVEKAPTLAQLIEDVKGIDSLDAPNQQKKLLALVLHIADKI